MQPVARGGVCVAGGGERMNIEVYTDGAAIPNPGSVGWAAVFVVDGRVKRKMSGHLEHATNNEAEITAALRAVEAFTRPATFTICSDSEYVVKSMSVWIPDRGTRGYANAELFNRLIAACEQHTVTWRWVRGHNGDTFNEIANDLANERAENGG